MAEFNPFRRDLPPARSKSSIWPLLAVAASCLFVGDVAIRRIRMELATWLTMLHSFGQRLIGRQAPSDETVTINRLQQRKAELRQQHESMVSKTRLENDLPTSDHPTPTIEAAAEPTLEEPTESYSERLLRAKHEATQRKK